MNEQLERLKSNLLEKKENVQIELRKNYRAARKQVREHPEKGLLIALFGGILVGAILTKVISSKKESL